MKYQYFVWLYCYKWVQYGYSCEHFANVGKLSKHANNAEVEIKDYKLTHYACYLIAQNGDSRKKVIALAQTYLTKKGNYLLNQFVSYYTDRIKIKERQG